MKSAFDLVHLDAKFHLDALGERYFLSAPLGVADWQKYQNQLIFSYLLGKHSVFKKKNFTEELETSICRTFNAEHCITTGSGREAIKLALISISAEPGDRVILPSFCCLSVLFPVLELGLEPIFTETGDDLQIDPQSVRRVIRPGDRALIIPHLFGGLADTGALVEIAREHGVSVIDDAAQAIGLHNTEGWAGCGGDIGIFSFGYFKPINAMGGGAFVTNDLQLYNNAKRVLQEKPAGCQSRGEIIKGYLKTAWRKTTYRAYLYNRLRQQKKNTHSAGLSGLKISLTRMSPFNAALANSLLADFPERRRRFFFEAENFSKQLCRIPNITTPGEGKLDGFPRYVIRLNKEIPETSYKQIFKGLLHKGIEVQPTYRPLHKIMMEAGYRPRGEFLSSEVLSKELMCLPFPTDTNRSLILQAMQDVMG